MEELTFWACGCFKEKKSPPCKNHTGEAIKPMPPQPAAFFLEETCPPCCEKLTASKLVSSRYLKRQKMTRDLICQRVQEEADRRIFEHENYLARIRRRQEQAAQRERNGRRLDSDERCQGCGSYLVLLEELDQLACGAGCDELWKKAALLKVKPKGMCKKRSRTRTRGKRETQSEAGERESRDEVADRHLDKKLERQARMIAAPLEIVEPPSPALVTRNEGGFPTTSNLKPRRSSRLRNNRKGKAKSNSVEKGHNAWLKRMQACAKERPL